MSNSSNSKLDSRVPLSIRDAFVRTRHTNGSATNDQVDTSKRTVKSDDPRGTARRTKYIFKAKDQAVGGNTPPQKGAMTWSLRPPSAPAARPDSQGNAVRKSMMTRPHTAQPTRRTEERPSTAPAPTKKTTNQIVTESWASVRAAFTFEELGQLFYEALFQTAPALRDTIFGNTDMAMQPRVLINTINAAVKLLDQPEMLVTVLLQLGERHAGYGAEEAHYTVVGQVFLGVLANGLGDAPSPFTDEVKAAWSEVYGLIQTKMLEGQNNAKGKENRERCTSSAIVPPPPQDSDAEPNYPLSFAPMDEDMYVRTRMYETKVASPTGSPTGRQSSERWQVARGSLSVSAAKSASLLKSLREVGDIAVATARFKKLVPSHNIENLAERGIDMRRLNEFLDTITRFLLKTMGLAAMAKLRRQRMLQDAEMSLPTLLSTLGITTHTESHRKKQKYGISEGSEDDMKPVLEVELDSSPKMSIRHEVLSHAVACTVTNMYLVAEDNLGDSASVPLKCIQVEDVSEGYLKLHIDTTGEPVAGSGPADIAEGSKASTSGSKIAESMTNHPTDGSIVYGDFSMTFSGRDARKLTPCLLQHHSSRLTKMTRALSIATKRKLRILHFNDVYHLTPHNPRSTGLVGGAARFLTKVREIQRCSNPLILFSGDFMSPSLMSVLMHGRQMIDAFNLIGVHYGTYGNHEFDYGLKALGECIYGSSHHGFVFAGSHTKWIMSNIHAGPGRVDDSPRQESEPDQQGSTSAEPSSLVAIQQVEEKAPINGAEPYALFSWDGIMVGILGLSENWLPSCSRLKKGEAHYEDVFEVGERMAQELHRKGAEIVIALTHNRYANDKEMSCRCPSIDLILGGHDHFYKNSPSQRIVKSGEEFEWLSQIDVSFSGVQANRHDAFAPSASGHYACSGPQQLPTESSPDASVSVSDSDPLASSESSVTVGNQLHMLKSSVLSTGHSTFKNDAKPRRSNISKVHITSHPIIGSIPEDPLMLMKIARYEQRLNIRMKKVIGVSTMELDATEACCRFKEGLLGGFFCDVMASETKSEFAVLGGAAIAGKKVNQPGDITVGDVFNWFPNDTRIMKVRLKGYFVKKLLEVMVKEVPNEAPSFPQCSGGIRFTINTMHTPTTVEGIFIRGFPLDEGREYTVAVEDFVGKGKAKYKFVPKEGELLTDAESAEQLTYWIVSYFEDKQGNKKKGDDTTKLKSITSAWARKKSSVKLGETAMEKSMEKSILSDESISMTEESHLVSHASFRARITDIDTLTEMKKEKLGAKRLGHLVSEMTSLVQESTDLRDLYMKAEFALMSLVKCDHVTIYHYESSTSRFWYYPSLGDMHTRCYAEAHTGIFGATFATGQVIIAEDCEEHPQYDPHAASMAGYRPRVLLSCPVLYDGECLAVAQAIKVVPRDPFGGELSSDEEDQVQPFPNSSPLSAPRKTPTNTDLEKTDSGASSLPRTESGEQSFSTHDMVIMMLYLVQLALYVHQTRLMMDLELSHMRHRVLLDSARELASLSEDVSVGERLLMIQGYTKKLLSAQDAHLYLHDPVTATAWTVELKKDSKSKKATTVIRRALADHPLLAESIIHKSRTMKLKNGNVVCSRTGGTSTSNPQSPMDSPRAVPQGAALGDLSTLSSSDPVTPGSDRKPVLLSESEESSKMEGNRSSCFKPDENTTVDEEPGVDTSLHIPVFIPQSKCNDVLGCLVINNKTNFQNFTQTDEDIAGAFASFAAIAIHTTIEIEALRSGVNRAELQKFPIHELGRIKWKRGWGSVRSRLKFIVSEEFKAILKEASMQE